MKHKGVELKTYVGDSVYMDFDGCHYVLTTDNGQGTTNIICLEPEVLGNINRHAKWIRDLFIKEEKENEQE